MHGIVAYTFLDVCEKFTSSCPVLKKMHTEENRFLFFCLTVCRVCCVDRGDAAVRTSVSRRRLRTVSLSESVVSSDGDRGPGTVPGAACRGRAEVLGVCPDGDRGPGTVPGADQGGAEVLRVGPDGDRGPGTVPRADRAPAGQTLRRRRGPVRRERRRCRQQHRLPADRRRRYDTIRYDTIREAISTCARKLT